MYLSDEQYARNLVKVSDPDKIPDYFTSSDLPRGVNWGGFIGHHRDSDVLNESNWEAITRDLEKKFGPENEENGWVIERDNHWAVGWVETVYIKYFRSHYFMDIGLTEIGQWAVETRRHLEDHYPVYDEEHFLQAEFNSAQEEIETEFYRDGEAELAFSYIEKQQLSPDYSSSWDWKQIQEIRDYVTLSQWDWEALKAECQRNYTDPAIKELRTWAGEQTFNEDVLTLACEEHGFSWQYADGYPGEFDLYWEFEKQDETVL